MSETTSSRTDGITRRLPEVDYWRYGLTLLIVAFFAFFISPIWTGLVTSFKTTGAVTATTPFAPPPPDGFTIEKWTRAFEHLSRGLVNSLIMAVPATLLDVLLGSTAAYGLTLVDWGERRWKLPVLVLFLIGIFIPYQAVIVPLADFWTNIVPLRNILAPLWGLSFLTESHADLVALIITHVAYGIPICMLLFRSYYHTISDELVEAAKIDGASVTGTYLRIILPLSKPMIGVVLIYQFTQIWNEFLFSLTLIGSSSDPAATITLVLSGIGADLTGIDFGLRMAAAFISALPTLIIYLIFADQFAKGLQT